MLTRGLEVLLNNKGHDDEQEISEMQFEDVALKANVLFLRADQRVKQNYKDIFAGSSTKTKLVRERTWTDIEPQDYSTTNYSVSKELSTLLRDGSLLREDDGAIEFWR